MDLDTAANYAEIIGLLTILGAAVYSWYQIKEMKASRESQGALFVGDALAGNDAIEQAMEFQRMLKSDGAALCKLDTDVKGGAALSIAHATGRPIVLAGIGQGYDDLKQFEPDWLLELMFE